MEMKDKYTPRLIAWEVTRTCHMNCKHCRGGAVNQTYDNEFTLDEIKKVLDNVASFAKPIIILTGGEPMLRDDIYEISFYGNSIGLRMVMAPCGMLITEESIEKMKEAGIKRISLSIDGASAETHDVFRQKPGAFDEVIKAAKIAKKNGMEFQINSTIHKKNVKELPKILDLAVDLGAESFHPFLLVPTGRAKSLADQEIPPEEYEKVLIWIYDQKEKVSIQFKPTCAPHFYRILRQRSAEQGNTASSPDPHYGSHPHAGFHSSGKGCIGGQAFAFISHIGKVQICGFLEEEAGDLRKENYNFKQIWDNSPLFIKVRDVDNYSGRCGYCEFRKVCGGCRARAFAVTGDYTEEEPYCIYEPKMN